MKRTQGTRLERIVEEQSRDLCQPTARRSPFASPNDVRKTLGLASIADIPAG